MGEEGTTVGIVVGADEGADVIIRIRLLLVSATYKLPDASIAIESGYQNNAALPIPSA